MIGMVSNVTISKLRPTRWALLPLAALACAAVAQTGQSDDEGPSNGLNIPAFGVVFGKNDPSIRKPTAIVNGDIITRTDVEQRLALIISASGGQIPAEEIERLQQLNCHYAQGFAFGAAMTGQEFGKRLAAQLGK